MCSDLLPQNQAVVEAREDKTLTLRYKMRNALDHMPSPPAYDSGEDSNNLRLKKTAEKVLASTVYAGSTSVSIAYSDWGDRSEGERKANVEGWIRTLEEVERDTGFTEAGNAPPSAPSETSHEDNTHSRRISSNTSIETEGTFDISTKLVRNLSNQGKDHYEKGNYEYATSSFLSALQHADKLRKDPSKTIKLDLTEVHFKLASMYLESGMLNESEQHLLQVIDESTNNESELIQTYLKLGQLYLSRTSLKEAADLRGREVFLESAEEYCMKAVNGCGQHHGEDSPLYYEAVQMLAKTYVHQGRRMEAEALLMEVPEDLRVKEAWPQSAQPIAQPSRRVPSLPLRIKPRRSSHFPWLRSTSESQEPEVLSPVSANNDNETTSRPNPRRDSDLLPSISTNDEDPQSLLASANFTGDFNTEHALIWAIKQGSEKVVHLLLQGFPIRVRKRGLGFSSQERVIEKKADPNGSHKGDHLPLMVAIKKNRVLIAKTLLTYGADPTMGDDKRRTPLFVAAEYGQAELIKLIPQARVALECNAPQTWTPLHVASKNGHEEVVLYLLDAGAETDIQDVAGATALKVAASGGHEAVVRALVDHGAALNIKDELQFTALMSCIKLGHIQIAQFLLENSASLADVNFRSESVLMIAVKENREEAVRLLIEAGANVETPDMHGWTPLIHASDKGYTAIVRLLIDAKANCNRSCNQGSTALDHARIHKRREIERILERMKAETGSRMVQPRYHAIEPYRGYAI